MNAPAARAPRIGLYGGRFDPIHAAHLLLARSALEQFALDRVLFIVSGTPAQKAIATDVTDRLRMVELAIADEPRFAIEPIEAGRAGPSYSIDTALALRALHGPDAMLVWLMGSDQFHNLSTWHRHDELLDVVNLGVARRHHDPAELPLRHVLDAPHGEIASFEMPAHAGAATDVREAIATHHDDALADLVHPDVLAYIRANHLYRGPAART